MFLDNAEYRKFLFQEFGVSTMDEESAAVVMVSSAQLPYSYSHTCTTYIPTMYVTY